MNFFKFNIINDKGVDIFIILEPTGEEYILKPKEKCMILCKNDSIEPIEFDYHDECIIVYSLENSIIGIKTE